MTAGSENRGLTRRRFAQLTSAAVAAGSVPQLGIAAQMSVSKLPVNFVYDSRIVHSSAAFENAFDFARIHAFTGDVTGVWLSALRPMWEQQCYRTMGYTRHAERFVLVTLARECGYAVSDLENDGERFLWQLAPI